GAVPVSRGRRGRGADRSHEHRLRGSFTTGTLYGCVDDTKRESMCTLTERCVDAETRLHAFQGTDRELHRTPVTRTFPQPHRRGFFEMSVEYRIGSARLTLIEGDITQQEVDAVVNAANSSLLGGGGVDGASHRRGGPEILAECRRLRASSYGRGLPAGRVVATAAGRLPARWVIHTLGPVYSAEHDRSDVLASCYRGSLAVAEELRARSAAFPAISTGVYRWPVDSAARFAVREVRAHPAASVREVRFVLFTPDAYAAF